MEIEEITGTIDYVLASADVVLENLPKEVDRESLYMLTLILTLYDITTDINHLTKARRFLNMPSLLRNFMDSYVDLLLIEKDKKFILQILLKDCESRLKLIKGKINPEYNSCFKNELEEINHQKKEQQGLESYAQSLRQAINEPIISNVKNKYKQVGMLWFYETIYNSLCSHTHNSTGILESRHIEASDSKVILKYCQEYDYKDYRCYYEFLLYYFYDAIKILNEKMILKQEEIIGKMEAKISLYIKE